MDNIRLGSPYASVKQSLQSWCSSYREDKALDTSCGYFGVVEGKHFAVSYERTAKEGGYTGVDLFSSSGKVIESTGFSLQAGERRTVLRVGDSTEEAEAWLGPATRFVPESAHLLGVYWLPRHLAIYFHSESGIPETQGAELITIVHWDGAAEKAQSPDPHR